MERHLNRLTELISVWTPDGILSSYNDAYCQFFGVAPEELVGRSWLEVIPPDHRPGAVDFLRDFVMHPRPNCREQAVRDAAGEVRWVEWISQPIQDESGRLCEVLSEGRDISARKRAEEQARHAERYREATLVLLRLLNEEDQTRELLRQLTDLLRGWTGCEALGVRLREGEDFPFFETRGFPADFVRSERSICSFDQDGQLLLDEDGQPRLECLCGRVARGQIDRAQPCFSQRGSFWTNAASGLNGAVSMPRGRCQREGYESLALVPLRHGDQVLGLLQLADRRGGRFSDGLVSFLENAGDQIAVALAHKAKLSSLEGGLRQIAALLAEIGVGAQEDHRPLPPTLRAALASLSPRETEVLRLLLHNRRPATIARELSRSVHTVRNQLKAIFRKLNVHSQEELLARLGPNADLLAGRHAKA